MLDFLKTIFGADIKIDEFNYPDETPFYIRDGYTAQALTLHQNKCVLITPKSSAWRLPTLKKQLLKFQEICAIPCALSLDNMTALQRRNLIENNIPFVSLSQQVYLPFWGSCFTERFKAATPVTEKMSPGTQLVFLYLYYSHNKDSINLTQISKDLRLSKATCTRAVNDLSASGLIEIRAEGTNKWLSLAYERPEFLKKGYSRLRNPVDRYIYVKHPVSTLAQFRSGMLALSELTMVGANDQDGSLAISKKAAADIPVDLILTEQNFKDFGGYLIEVWCYDPSLLSNNGQVDDISLLLSLENNSNERIQMGLDDIREKHELPIKDEE